MEAKTCILGCLLVLFTAANSPAQLAQGIRPGGQPQPAPNNFTEVESADQEEQELSNEQPQREINFEISDEEVETKLFRADPELLEQRFVAHVEIGPMEHNPQDDLNLSLHLWNLAHVGNYSLLDTNRSITEAVSLKDFFARLIEAVGDDSASLGKGVEFFLSDAVEDGRVTLSPVAPGERHFRFRILAPSELLARERAEALLHLLDRAIRFPVLEHFQTQVAAHADELETTQQKLTAALKTGEQLDKEWAAMTADDSIVDADELKRLTTERRLLDVDLAGIRARIEAAEEIIAKLRGNAGAEGVRRRIEQLEDIKVTAEIDLAGLAARRETLDQIIKQGQERKALVAKINQMHAEINGLREHTSQALSMHRKMIDYAEQLFSLKDDKVVIHPIKWTGTE